MLIFGKLLDDKFLTRVSSDYLLNNLHVVPKEASPDAGASVPLLDPTGATLATMEWSPDLPGYELLRFVLPMLGLSTVVLGAFAWLVFRNARISARALEESARTIEAYAQTLEESEARFRDVAEASSDWIWESDPDLRFTYCPPVSARSPAFGGGRARQVPRAVLLQRYASSDDWLDPDRRHAGPAHLSRPSLLLPRRDRRQPHLPHRWPSHPRAAVVSSAIAAPRPTSPDEVEAQARGQLSGAARFASPELPNRVLLRERLSTALAGDRARADPVAVLCLDLDHFKEVNDTLGHGAGDLISAAGRGASAGARARPVTPSPASAATSSRSSRSASTSRSRPNALSRRLIDMHHGAVPRRGPAISSSAPASASRSPQATATTRSAC